MKLWEITVPAFPKNSVTAKNHDYKVVEVGGDKIAVSTVVAIPTKTTTFPLPGSYWEGLESLSILFLSSLAQNNPFGSGDPRNLVHNVFDERVAYNLTLASPDRIFFLETAAAQDLAIITGLHPNLTLPKVPNWTREHISPRKPAAAESPIAAPSQFTREVTAQSGHKLVVALDRFSSGMQTLRMTPKSAVLLMLLLITLVWVPGLAVLILVAAGVANFNAPSMRFLRDLTVEAAWSFPRIDTPGLGDSTYVRRQAWIKAKEDFATLELMFYNVDKDPEARLTSHLALYVKDLPETAKFFTAFSAAQNAVKEETKYRKGSELAFLVKEAQDAWNTLVTLSETPSSFLDADELRALEELKLSLGADFTSDHELRQLHIKAAVAAAELPRVSLPETISIFGNNLKTPPKPVELTKPLYPETKSLGKPKA